MTTAENTELESLSQILKLDKHVIIYLWSLERLKTRLMLGKDVNSWQI